MIATDDVGVLRSSLSNEYLMYTNHYKPSYAELKTLVYNSIHYSFLNEKDKSQQVNKLDACFRRFEPTIADVVDFIR